MCNQMTLAHVLHQTTEGDARCKVRGAKCEVRSVDINPVSRLN